jgi:SAM-dependent methyltransferase
MNLIDQLRRQTWLRRIRWFGLRYACPVCGARLKGFVPHKSDPKMKDDALCPVCLSKNPHRRAVLLFRQLARENPSPGEILHVAPEPRLGRHMQRLFRAKYISGDILPGVGQLQFDIAEMPFRDGQFGLLFGCHVMMMLPRDRIELAVRECFRVLKPGGTAILENPVLPGHTIEMESKTDEERREKWYSPNVLRMFGALDYWPMFERAGFQIEHRKIATPVEVERHQLYFDSQSCLRKPA